MLCGSVCSDDVGHCAGVYRYRNGVVTECNEVRCEYGTGGGYKKYEGGVKSFGANKIVGVGTETRTGIKINP